ncbi:MAG: site-2 protease family protein [Pirellulales bacterium]
MASAAFVEAAADRALGLRARPDLQFRPQQVCGTRYWAVKDPLSLRYFHLRDEEYAVLRMLDGEASMDDVRRSFERTFAPRRLGREQLHGYLATLHRYGLLLAESRGQGEQLPKRQREQTRRRRYETLLGVLAIRFPGFNPARLLDWLSPKVGWLFSPVCVIGVLTMGLAAVLMVAVQFDTFLARLPDIHSVVSASNLPWLLVMLAVVKILHELGHALACRRFGGDCHEMGLMLLVLTPCLYCNVSDSWMLPSKWRRIAVAAAGMYVELLLASICTFLWWASAPGLFHALCLNTMLICSIGTLVLNGNPLLRYDGYYILSDLVDVPNLRSESAAAARRIFARLCLGLELPGAGGSSRRRDALLAAYWLAAASYRWIVVIAILWALNLLARQYHLEPLMALVAAVTLVGMALPGIAAARRWAGDPSRRRRMAPLRVALSGGLALAAVLVIVLWPMPMRVKAPLVLDYRDAHRVYVTVPGRLLHSATPGKPIAKGQPIAQLASDAMDLELSRLAAQRDVQKLLLRNLESRQLHGTDDGARVPTARAALADLDQRLEQLRGDAARLTIVAPRAGTVLPPPALPANADADKLPIWSGTPLEQRNLGSHLDTGTLVCLVGEPQNFEAVLHVAQNDVELVEPGQRVRMIFDHQPGQIFWGTVRELAKLDLKTMPRELAAAGDLPSHDDPQGVRRPLDTWYQARVELDDAALPALTRVHGTAKINVPARSLAGQWARWISQTFSRSRVRPNVAPTAG